MASTSKSATNSGQSQAVFHQSIQSLFDSWTCLQLAVKHGFGGPHSLDKEKWMVDAVFNWFNENEGIEPYELEDFLADILDHEFDTIADDGSLNDIATNICTNYQLCRSGHQQTVLDKLQKTPAARLGECVADEPEGMQEDDMDTAGMQEANMQARLGGLGLGQSASQPTSASGQVSDAPSTSSPSSVPGAGLAAESENVSNMEEDDGWTVVRKSKKK